jgi:pimeloyl-ACP methyl ester carboxylesterase
MVSFWYPADNPPAGAVPAPEYDPLFAASSVWSQWGVDLRWRPVAQKLVQHAYSGIPFTTNAGTFPVVLLSHGLGSFRKTFQPLVIELASHGYIAVTVDHPDCYGSEFPDGRFLLQNDNGNGPDRLKDMQFLLGKLAQMQNDDPLFAGRLDLVHVGVFGHSWGGMVLEICRTNSQVKCAAVYDAGNFQLPFLGRVRKPLLFALGQFNTFLSLDQSTFNAETNHSVFFQLTGADHNTCTDAGWLSVSGRNQNRAFTDSLLWFFDTHLKGQSPIFPTNTAMYNLQMK